MRSRRIGGSLLAASLTAAFAVAVGAATPATATSVTLDQVVSAIPQAGTPNVDDGTVLALAQVGNTMVVGGSFTAVTGAARRGVFAFNVASRALSTSFAPVLDGTVNALWPGPTADTVYVGGAFTTVNGVRSKGLALLNVNTGARVASFTVPAMNGVVNTVKLVGPRLYVGGTFTTLAGVARGGLASLNPTTGALEGFVQNTVAVNHNWTPTNGAAKAGVGVKDLDVTPDGSTMVIIGNFKTVDGLSRDQAAVLDLTGAQSTVRAGWRTREFEPACYSGAFDTYVRDVDIAADGRWFVVGSTGGGVDGTLCDTVARFELTATGDEIPAVWRSVAGGDSILSVAIAGSVVYSGGHQRWMNNDRGNDRPGPGAVPRPGLVALDSRSGVPIAWNPGRNPRGSGAWTTYVTSAGLWVGSDTDWIGDRDYRRQKLAFFPLAGGSPLAAEAPRSLPAGIYLGNTQSNSQVLYRVNAGGPSLPAADDGPDWAGDSTPPSPYVSAGSNTAVWGAGAAVDATVPAGTPAALFDSERWDPGSSGDGGEMSWAFPVPAGQEVELRLFFANRCSCTSGAGQRSFDVAVDGAPVLDDFDIVAAVGDQTGTMRSFTVTSDGTLDVDLAHVVENPLVNGIEIVKTGPPPPVSATFGRRDFDGSTASALIPLAGELSLTTTRGVVLIGNRLFYGSSDGTLWSRTFQGGTYGPAAVVDPYNDPRWSDVDTGSGQTFRGTRPDFYTDLPSVTSLFYSDARLYYTLFGSTALHYRPFSPDSGIVGAYALQVPGVSMPDVTGAFLAGGRLHVVDRATGSLSAADFAGGVPGAFTTVSGPGRDGIDWRSRVLFAGPGTPANTLPTAAGAASCDELRCSFDAAGSADPDGAITSYAWDFGDGSTGTGVAPVHEYQAAGSYPVTLTVTDDRGGNASDTLTVNPAPLPVSPIAFRAQASVNKASATPALTVPGTVRAGDQMLLIATSGTATSQAAPAGWTRRAQQASSGVLTSIWERTATAADPGSTVTVTLNASTKVDVHLVAYSGAGPVSAVQTAGAGPGTVHVAPSATVATAGSWVVRYWADKSSATTRWTLPGNGIQRDVTYGSGSGYISVAIADSGGSSPTGASGTATATTDATSARDETATIVLPPR